MNKLQTFPTSVAGTFIFISGIVFILLENWLCLCAAFCSTGVLIITNNATLYRKIMLLFATILLFTAGAWRTHYFYTQHATIASQLAGNRIDLIGTVISCDQTSSEHYSFTTTIFDKHIGYAIKIYTPEPLNVQIDDTIMIKNLLMPKNNQSSYQIYLLKEHIVATVFCSNPNVTILKRPLNSLKRDLALIKSSTLESLSKKLSPTTFSLFSSIFLGYKQPNSSMDSIREQFAWWGISHYLARSGLHLVVIILMFSFLMLCLPVRFFIKEIILILLILSYWLLTWSSISFIRALITFLLYKFCAINLVNHHTLHLIMVVTFLVLVANPYQLCFLDFQLSFGLTFALAWYGHCATLSRQS